MRSENQTENASQTGLVALLAGAVAALLASACCLGPWLLLALGLSGAWIGGLTAFEPYRPAFSTAALVALLFAWRKVWRSTAACDLGNTCAASRARYVPQVMFCVVAALTAVALGFPVIAPWFY
jgi:mercuric ion transport protein